MYDTSWAAEAAIDPRRKSCQSVPRNRRVCLYRSVQEVSIRVGAEGEFCVHVCACVCMCFSVKRESLSINFVTDHELGHDYAYQTFKRLVKPGSDHAEDIQSLWLDVKFPGNKQKPTPAMTIRGLQRLLMMLSNIKNMTSLARSHTRTHTRIQSCLE